MLEAKEICAKGDGAGANGKHPLRSKSTILKGFGKVFACVHKTKTQSSALQSLPKGMSGS